MNGDGKIGSVETIAMDFITLKQISTAPDHVQQIKISKESLSNIYYAKRVKLMRITSTWQAHSMS